MAIDPLKSLQPFQLSSDLVGAASEILAREGFKALPALELLQPATAGGGPYAEVQRRVSELVEAIMGTVAGGAAGTPSSYNEQVPLLRCLAAVSAGDTALAEVRVSNDDDSAAEVSLYASNFIADTGYELGSLCLSVSPRKLNVPAKGVAKFDIKVAVPMQTPAGTYSGLIQATGCKYVKAVLMVEVS
jgi:hypothetical protein